MDTTTSALLCSRLKELRTDKKLTQKEFAQKIGASSVSVSSYEIGAKTPSLDMLLTIAKTFEVSLDWMCGLSDFKNTLSKLETQADILRCLFLIERCTPLDIFSNQEDILENGTDLFDNPRFRTETLHEIALINRTLNSFILEWKKILNLYQNNTIDDDLYNLWIDKTLKKAADYRSDGFPLCFTDSDIEPPTTK